MRLTTRRDLWPDISSYREKNVTYAEVGATTGALPEGYHHTRRRALVGGGQRAFDIASRTLLSWEMHRRSGLTVSAEGPAQPGTTVLLGRSAALGVGSISLLIPCRVVYVVDEPLRQGFAYGTLPDHPEQGEEAFMVTKDDADSVWLDIIAFSRPAALLLRMAGPLGRALQSAATDRYERALKDGLAA